MIFHLDVQVFLVGQLSKKVNILQALINVIVKRALYIVWCACGIDAGEIKAENEIEIVLGSRVMADRQMAEHRIKLVIPVLMLVSRRQVRDSLTRREISAMVF